MSYNSNNNNSNSPLNDIYTSSRSRNNNRQELLSSPITSPSRRSHHHNAPPPPPLAVSAGQSALRQLASNRTAASVVVNHSNNNNGGMSSSSLYRAPPPQPAAASGSALGGLVDRLESSSLGLHHRDNAHSNNNNGINNNHGSYNIYNKTSNQQSSSQQQSTPKKEGWINVPTTTTTILPSQRSLHAAAIVHDALYLFGGYDGHHRVNDFYMYNFTTKCWREIVTLNGTTVGGSTTNNTNNNNGRGGDVITATGNVPTPRDRHAAVVYKDMFYIFGGFDGTSRVCDLYGFDVKRLVWKLIVPRVGGGEGNIVNVDAGGGGGNVGQQQQQQLQQNGNHIYNNLDGDGPQPPQQQPQQPQQHYDPPSPRHSHAAVVHQDSLYIFGGYDGSYRSDFHEFNFLTSTWRPVFGSGRSPRARYRSTAVVHEHTMIVFGGHDGTRHLADVHTFDFVRGVWSSLVIDGVAPLPRDSHVSVVYKDSVFVFGGSTGSAMNDLHELILPCSSSSSGGVGEENEDGGGGERMADLSAGDGPEDGGGPSSLKPRTAKWRQIPQMSGEGIAVHRFCHVGAMYNGSFYVFGGYDGSHRLNDFVKYDLAADDLLETDIPPPSLLADLRSFLDDEDAMSLSDITIMVEGIPVRAHKLMLMRCPYFKAMLLGNMSESTQSVVHIEIVRHRIFLVVLEYLYTDEVEIPLEIAMELFVAADLFAIPRLQSMCERRLLESMTVENAATIFHTADVHSASSLRGKALGYIMTNFEAVSKTDAFEDMARSNVELVFEILRSR